MNDSGLSTMSLIYGFEPLRDPDRIPFPLDLGFSSRLLIAIILTAVFLRGLGYRSGIFRFLAAEDSKKPINQLIILDQLNGMLLSVGLLIRIIALLYPYPLESLLGPDFCFWASLPGTIYLSGKTSWSCLIALMRVTYIRAQNFLHFKVGERRLLCILSTFGMCSSLSVGLLLTNFDRNNVIQKVCRHLSDTEIEIFEEYSGHGSTRKYFLTGVSLAGIFCTMIELVSYALVFKHIAYHDNHVACHILEPEVIQRRNRSTTISMLGLLLCWLLDVFYISCTGLLFTLYDFGRLRELASLLKTVDFVLVPWIQTLTTPPIRKFIQRSGGQDSLE